MFYILSHLYRSMYTKNIHVAPSNRTCYNRIIQLVEIIKELIYEKRKQILYTI